MIFSFTNEDKEENGKSKESSDDGKEVIIAVEEKYPERISQNNLDAAEKPGETRMMSDPILGTGKEKIDSCKQVAISSKPALNSILVKARKSLTLKMLPAWVLLLIVTVFSLSAMLNYISGPCSVQVLSREGDSPIDEWGVINYAPGSNVLEKWSENTSTTGYSVYSCNIRLAITSRGFLNWIHAVEIETDTPSNGQEDNLYRWTVVYDFHGTKIVNGCLKMYLEDNQPPAAVQVTIRVRTTGLLGQGTLEWQHTIHIGTD